MKKSFISALAFCAALAMAWLPALSGAQAPPVDATITLQVKQLALDAAKSASAATPGARVEIEVGTLDPRLRLAPCPQVQPYLPANARLWGASRIGLRCVTGITKWNVYLPVTVRVYANALVAATALPAGTVLSAADLAEAEVDLAAGTGTAVAAPPLALGRSLARPLAPGAALRSTDLKPRQWFAAGDTVKIIAAGSGYAVSGEGRALSPGLEGRPVRVRTEGGRIVSGQAVAERQVEVAL